MDINISELKRVVIIEISGRVDSNNAGELGSVLDIQVKNGNHNIILKMDGVKYLCSDGLREMVYFLKKVKRSGGDIRIAAPSDSVKEIMMISGLETIFKIYPTEIEAVGSF